MATIRLADYVIQRLAAEGVRDFFTVVGGGSIFLCDALALNKEVRYVCCHHEQSVAMAAEAHARITGKIGVSIVTTGPGGTNAITGVAGSWMDSVPHVIISGQAFLAQTIGASGLALRQLGVQEINIVDLVKPITKYAVLVEKPEEIRYHLEKALHLAKTGRPGPVWLDLPADVQKAMVDPAKLRGFSADEVVTQYDNDLVAKVRQVVSHLKNSKRPLLHVGQGIRIAGLVDRFLALVERHRIPFVTARNANDIVSSDHELFMGRPGTFPQRHANFVLQNADFYLAIGTRLSLPQTGYNAKDFAKNATKVMVDIDRAELDKKTLNIDIKVHTDARNFLDELERQLEGVEICCEPWIEKCAEWRRCYPVVSSQQHGQSKWVNSYHFVDKLSDMMDENDVIVTDMGVSFQGTHQALKIKKGQRFFTNSGFASMGWGLPAAIGASMASGQRTMCISGDGGLMMNLQEIATVKQYNLPVKLFILNNLGYLTIKQTQELGFEGRYMGINSDTGLYFPNFGKIAEAHEIPFVKISNHKELGRNLDSVLGIEGPVICEIMMDPDQLQAPKAINRRKVDGSFEPTPLEDIFPFIERKDLEEIMSVSNNKI